MLELGAGLAGCSAMGCDKLTLSASAGLRSFPDWLEQLVAESTGKLGRGLVPVLGEPLLAPEAYGRDRLFAGILLEADRGGELERQLRQLGEQGQPVVLIHLRDALDLGFEMFRWEVAVALAGSILELNPFDQPDVQLAKQMARRAMSGGKGLGSSLRRLQRYRGVDDGARGLASWLPGGPPAYISLQAYLPPDKALDRSLRRLQAALRRATGCATTSGYGPRFLHSTGQLHKGGPATVWCLQLTANVDVDLDIPGERISFGQLIAAQADGDAAALLERQREVCRIELASPADLDRLVDGLEES